MADTSSASACTVSTPCLLGQRAPALGKGPWQPSGPGSAKPWQAAGGSAVQGPGAAAVEHATVFLQLGPRHCHRLQVSTSHLLSCCATLSPLPVQLSARKEKTTPFGVNLKRSLVIYQAAQSKIGYISRARRKARQLTLHDDMLSVTKACDT